MKVTNFSYQKLHIKAKQQKRQQKKKSIKIKIIRFSFLKFAALCDVRLHLEHHVPSDN